MWISKYFVYFMLFSVMGWIYESIFCTLKSGKWQNRGFLYGPMCPIYGVGATLMTFIMDMVGLHGMTELVWWQIFLIAFFGSMILEYVTSYALEKLFHAYWWDYSGVPFNVNGRICLPASIGFGVAGLLVVYILAPFMRMLTDWITPAWMEFFALVFMAMLTTDMTLTISALTDFEHRVIALEQSLNEHMDVFVNTVQERTQVMSEVLAEERARFSKENMERSIKNMEFFHRLALKRVKGFRSTNKEREKHVYSREMVLESVKRYIQNNKKMSRRKDNN
ncbi:MAG: putative ABC transporter permease [Eubacterium sp.]|nr:putative ABC transporter permease [Eubacterium sp.]